MVDIGTLGGRHSTAVAINDFGQVVGQAETDSLETHAFSWTAAGGMVDLGVAGTQSGAMDVSNSGAVIVRRTTFPTVSSYVWTAPGSIVELGSLGGGSTVATAINDSGAVVGDSTTASGARHPFLWTPTDGMLDLGSLGGAFATATDINNAGEVVGRADIPGGDQHAFYWSATTGPIIDLPTLGGDETEAAAINESGQVVGYGNLAPNSNDEHAFIWTLDHGMTDLGVADANDINNSGQIAATNRLPGGPRRAALVRPAGAEPDPDADGNGIDDVLEVAGQPAAFSDANAPPTYGSIVDANGNTVHIAEAASPDGARITVTGPGTAKSTFSVCGFTLKLAPGSDVIVTCGSITVEVISGAAEIVLGDGVVVVTVTAGATAKVSDLGGGSYSIENLGESGDVTVDVDGESSPVTPGQTTTVSTADTTPPQVVCADAPTFTIRQPGASVSASVTDADSGAAASPVSAAANTSQVGTFTADVTGSDNAGNSTTVGCTFSVRYAFQGFASPIDNLPTINSAKAGQAVPVKWRITDYLGVGVSDPTSFTSVTTSSVSCSQSASFDAVEVYTGNSGLQYLGNGWWQFNWKTPKSYAGLCREMRLNLADAVTHTAAFTFK